MSKLWTYPPAEYIANGAPFEISKIKALRKLFPPKARLKLVYDPDEFPDFEIWYQPKPRAHWKTVGRQSAMLLAPIPENSREAFLRWINELYEEVVDVEDSEVEALYWDDSGEYL